VFRILVKLLETSRDPLILSVAAHDIGDYVRHYPRGKTYVFPVLDLCEVRFHRKPEETRELPGERDNARNNARCTKARKTTHGLDGQHQDVNRTLRGRVSQNDRGQRYTEEVRPWCGQPSDRGLLKNRTDHVVGSIHGLGWVESQLLTDDRFTVS